MNYTIENSYKQCYTPPRTAADCVEPYEIAEEFWAIAKRYEFLAKLLFWICFIGGELTGIGMIIYSIVDYFDEPVVIGALCCILFSYFVALSVYGSLHFVALELAAKASLLHSTHRTAKFAGYLSYLKITKNK